MHALRKTMQAFKGPVLKEERIQGRESRPKDTEVMSVCLWHIKAIIRDQFFDEFCYFTQWKGWVEDKLTVIDASFHNEHDSKNFSFVTWSGGKLQSFL